MATQFIYELTDTWNSNVTDFRAFKMSVTDAASGPGSRLVDFEVNGSSRFVVDKAGNLVLAGGATLGTALGVASGGTGGNTPADAREKLGITAAIEAAKGEAGTNAVATIRGGVAGAMDTLKKVVDWAGGTFQPLLGFVPTRTRSGNIIGIGWLFSDNVGRLFFNVDDAVQRFFLDSNDLALINSKLDAATYTPADILAKLRSVDGEGSGLDADLLDGQSSAFYQNIPARLGYTPVRNRTPGNAVWVGWDGNSGRTFFNVDDAVQRGYLDVSDLPRIDSKFQELRLTGNFSSGEAANYDAPSGGIITGYRRLPGTTGQVGQIVGKYLQGLSPSRGWVNAYNEG